MYDEIVYTLSYGTDPSDLTDVTIQIRKNYSLSFDGEDDFAEIDFFMALQEANEFSLAFWLNLYGPDVYLTMLCMKIYNMKLLFLITFEEIIILSSGIQMQESLSVSKMYIMNGSMLHFH